MRKTIHALALAVAAAFPATLLAEQVLPSEVHWVSVEEIGESLSGRAPMSVGFDIDDTVLFSSPCFYHGKQKYSPGSDDYLRDMRFWKETNGGCDRYSLPKEVGRKLIDLHQARGDRIFFITGRPSTPGEKVSEIIQQAFAIQAMSPVIFSSGPEKAALIRERGIALYYGDSDSDIRSARDAGIRGVRVMRASSSTNQPLPANGALGEEVIIDSDH